MHVSEKLVYRGGAPGVLCIIESHRNLITTSYTQLMIPHLLIHRVVKIEHVTHLICVSGANHVDVARDQGLDETSLANFRITKHHDIELKFLLNLP